MIRLRRHSKTTEIFHCQLPDPVETEWQPRQFVQMLGHQLNWLSCPSYPRQFVDGTMVVVGFR